MALFLSFFNLNGTASRKRGWFVFGLQVLRAKSQNLPHWRAHRYWQGLQ